MPRLTPRIRREMIIVAALHLAAKPGGWSNLTRRNIAAEAKCSDALVSAHLGSMSAVRRTLVKMAIKQENFDVLIQALVANDPEARKLCPLLRVKALSHISSGV